MNFKCFAFCAMTLFTTAVPGFAQSADPKLPAPLQPGDNIAVIHSDVQIPQYYYLTCGPGKGTLTVDYSSNGFPGIGGEIRVTVLNANGKQLGSYVVGSTKDVYSADAAKTGQLIIPFNLKEANKIVLRIDPSSSNLLVAAGRYNLQATGAVKFAEKDSNQAQDHAVGTYRIRDNVLGEPENGKIIKLLPNGTIESETGATGSWSLFDPGSGTYVLQISNKRSSLIFWPGVGFSSQSAGLPNLLLVR